MIIDKRHRYQPLCKHVCFIVSGKKILSIGTNEYSVNGKTQHAEERAIFHSLRARIKRQCPQGALP